MDVDNGADIFADFREGSSILQGDIGRGGHIESQKRVCVEAAAHHFEIGYVRYWFIIPIAWFDITPSSPSSIRYEPTYGTPPV